MDELIEYLKSLGGGKGPASNASIESLARALGVQVSAGDATVISSKKSFDGWVGSIVKGINVADKLTNKFGSMVESVVDFSKEQRKATQVVKDFSSVIPIMKGLGVAASSIISVLDDNMKSFQSMTGAGVYAGKRFNMLSRDAAALGIDLEKFTTNIQSASGDIARLGKGGLDFAVEESKRAFEANAESLMKYGYSFEESSEKFFSFLNQNSYAMRLYGKENVDLTKGAKSYSVYLKRLAELTGDQVDEAEDQIKKARANNVYNAFLQTIQDPATRAKYDAIVAAYGQMYGDEGREKAMAVIAGFEPMTKGAQQLGAMVQGLDGDLRMHRQYANNSAENMDQFTSTLFGDVAARSRGLQETYGQPGMMKTMLAASFQGADLPLQSIYGAMLKGTKSQEEINEILGRNVDDQNNNLNEMAKMNKNIRDTRLLIAEELVEQLGDTTYMSFIIKEINSNLENFNDAMKALLQAQGSTSAGDTASGKTDETTATKEAIENTMDDGILKNIANILEDIRDAFSRLFGKEGVAAAFDKKALANIQKELAIGLQNGGTADISQNKAVQDVFQMFLAQTGSQQEAQRLTLEALRNTALNPAVGYGGGKEMADMVQQGIASGKIKTFAGGTGGFGSLFQNFGKGQLSVLHNEEAVIPKDSPLGGMLNMMQGDLGNLKQNMFTADGKMNVSGMISSAQEMGKKYDTYAKENEGAIKDQSRGLVKSMTNLTDADLDRMEKESVKSNNTVSSGTSVNTMSGGKMDELIRINKQMLAELRNM